MLTKNGLLNLALNYNRGIQFKIIVVQKDWFLNWGYFKHE